MNFFISKSVVYYCLSHTWHFSCFSLVYRITQRQHCNITSLLHDIKNANSQVWKGSWKGSTYTAHFNELRFLRNIITLLSFVSKHFNCCNYNIIKVMQIFQRLTICTEAKPTQGKVLCEFIRVRLILIPGCKKTNWVAFHSNCRLHHGITSL